MDFEDIPDVTEESEFQPAEPTSSSLETFEFEQENTPVEEPPPQGFAAFPDAEPEDALTY